jgi:hypothetical protein
MQDDHRGRSRDPKLGEVFAIRRIRGDQRTQHVILEHRRQRGRFHRLVQISRPQVEMVAITDEQVAGLVGGGPLGIDVVVFPGRSASFTNGEQRAAPCDDYE